MRSINSVLATGALLASVLFTGCSSSSYSGNSGTAARTSHTPEAKPTSPATTSSQSASSMVSLTKTMPAQASVGEEFAYQIKATANESIGNVVIADQVPSGAAFVRSEPAAEANAGNLIWRIPQMAPGETKTITVTIKAEREGTLAACATVTAVPLACASTVVGKPALAIDKTGPETARLGDDVTYNIVVSNPGSSVAKNVVVTDNVPDGLTHSSGQTALRFEVGDLRAGQSKQIPVTLKAAKRGKVCNPAVATSSNAGQVKDEACTTILVPGLNIVKSGTKEQFIGKNAEYEIAVSNTGDIALNGVVVTDVVPPENQVVSAGGGTASGNTITWNVGQLPAGGQKKFTVTTTSRTAGNFCNTARVTSTEGLSGQSQACTLWRGYPALLIEVVDDPDPLQVGQTTTYTIRVTNQGTADDTNIKIVGRFPAELDPASAAGTTPGTVSGKTVTFGAFPRLAPKQSISWTVNARAASTGDGRVKVELTSDLLKRAVTEEESTQVY